MRQDSLQARDNVRQGASVAQVLAGAWRPSPSPLSIDPEALATAVPLLLQTTAAPLGWRRLRASGLPTRPLRNLQHAYRMHALETAGHEQHLQEAVPYLRAAGIEPILAKGWAMARHYPETNLRPYCDHDLCVRRDQVAAAMDALSKADRRDWQVELHQGIPDLKDRTWDEAYQRSRLVSLGNVEVRVLCPEDQFRLLCLHQMRHGCCAPLWLCDLGAALESRSADFDWDYCLRGHPSRAAWILCFVGLACQLLEARLDEPSLAARCDDLPSWLAPTVLERWARPLHESRLLDPIKSACRRKLRPGHTLRMTQFLGLVGRVVEAPSRLWRQVRRWRRPTDRPYELHEDPGA